MKPQTFQHPEIRDENDNIIQPGAFGKNTPFCTKENDGILDYVANDLEYLYKKSESADNDNLKAKSLAVSGTSDLNLVNADTVKAKSLAVSGTSTAPTAPTGDSSKTIANTEFVQNTVSGLVGAAPETLDTLNELASALGNDPNFATTVSNKIGINTEKINKNTQDIVNIQKDIYTGAVNKKTLTSVGYAVAHNAVVTAEIIGLTQDNLRRVKFNITGVCIEKGTNGAEFRWLNFCTGNFGISSAYTDIYPRSEFIRVEDDLVPMSYCGCLPENKREYGFMVNISKEQLQIGRIYTTNLDYGSYANSELYAGGFSFSFAADFTDN